MEFPRLHSKVYVCIEVLEGFLHMLIKTFQEWNSSSDSSLVLLFLPFLALLFLAHSFFLLIFPLHSLFLSL